MPSTPADPGHELPPPSAQRASWSAPAPVRARGSPGSRTVPARHGPWSGSKRDTSKHGEPRAGQERRVATSLATAGPARRSSSSRTKASNHHSGSQWGTVSTSSQTNPFPSISNPHPTHSPSHSSAAPAAPATRILFDPWNSSSTGHQRAENTVASSVSWRDSRNLKLGQQFKGGLAGGEKRVADTVGAGSEGFGKDGRKANGGWERGASGLRTGGQKSLVEIWGASKASTAPNPDSSSSKLAAAPSDGPTRFDEDETIVPALETSSTNRDACSNAPQPQKLIFGGLCIYVNGSTAPLVSDHKLKHMLAEHGAKMSIALGRRSVTHVILGAISANGGCGGGLAATKVQKEIARRGGKAIKFVTASWVLESIKEGRRLPETQFQALKLAHEKQGTVYDTFGAKE